MARNATTSMECSHAGGHGRLSKQGKKNLELEAPTCCASLPARRLSCQTRPNQTNNEARIPLGFRRLSHSVKGSARAHLSAEISTARYFLVRSQTFRASGSGDGRPSIRPLPPSCPVVLYEPTPPEGP
ncbi:hypothetical protein V2G26_006419 [Clonostachys chloroleuca]